MADYSELFRDDYIIVSNHSEGGRVAVQVGNPPKDGRPTIVDGEELYDALGEYLRDHHIIGEADNVE